MPSCTAFDSVWTPHQAVVVSGTGLVYVSVDITLPPCGPDEVVVKVMCVALNPADQKSIDLSPAVGTRLGSDFAGIIVHLGSNVQNNRQDSSKKALSVGDRVCGAVNGNNSARPFVGAFGEYVLASQHFTLKVPHEMTLEEAVTLPAGLITCGVALYKELGLDRPLLPHIRGLDRNEESGAHVLVYGASTATGCLAMQLLRMRVTPSVRLDSGYRPIGVCATKNFHLAESRGAVAVFDYANAEDCASSIRRLTQNKLRYVLDCISNSASMRICYASLGASGGRYIALDQFSLRGHTRKSIKPKWILANLAFGEPVFLEGSCKKDADPAMKAFHIGWFAEAQELLSECRILGHPVRLMTGGLECISEGLQCLRNGQVSGQKLVYHLADDMSND
ncbi:alcohol dehydrogenase [Colletotrichum incanum]|uniref:Alcohol dehydrogenase n=1 Tax=Colletotrichum incanum TaxID=1573173 RepID=A0A161W6X6_COLIC|nr:alcohol dehydrogenase [Colletotrichum incanum]OHW95339.1 alcohol dehydrogenase [Colletotrichum incanum]